MTKFESLIASNTNEVLKKRAANIATTADIAQQSIINNLKVRIVAVENQIMNLTDLAPNSTDSLRPGMPNWDANTWANDLQNAKETLYSLKVRYDIATKTYNEFFTEVTDESL
jgi:hypothetical protein